ncbi:HEAT repeat domain-containing protein [Thermopirellula anaerolimosa]
MSPSIDPSPSRRVARVAGIAAFFLGAIFPAFAAVLVHAEDDPFAAPGGAAPTAPQADAAKPAAEVEVPPLPEDPAVAMVLAAKPETPRELLRAAAALSSLKRPDLAKQMLEKFLAAAPDDAELLRLHQELGTAVVFRFGSDGDLAPSGRQVADMIFAAVNRRYQDAGVLNSWMEQLGSGGNSWYQAAEDLSKAGKAAVPLLVQAATENPQGELRGRCVFVLKRLRADAGRYLIALLQARDPAQQKAAAELLGEVGGRGASIFLLAPALSDRRDDAVRQAAKSALLRLQAGVPTAEQAARLIAAEAEAKLAMTAPDEGSTESFYYWNPRTSNVEELTLSPGAVRRRTAARLAAEASELLPGDQEAAVHALAFRLEQIGFELLPTAADGQSPAVQTADGSAVPALSAVNAGPLVTAALAEFEELTTDPLDSALKAIDYCLDRKWAGGAWAGIVWYAKNAPTDRVRAAFTEISPLSKALRFPDRRVRWAVVETAMDLELPASFRDSSTVMRELFYFASSRGLRRVIVTDGSQSRAMRIVGDLKQLGIEVVDTAADGNALLRSVADDPDVVFVLISADIQEPRVEFLVQRLRADPRTARLPVGVYALPDLLSKADRLAQTDPMVISFAQPYRPDDVANMAERLQSLPNFDGGNPTLRKSLAALAMRRISALAGNPGPDVSIQDLEDLAVRALYTSGAEKAGLTILRQLGTPRAQTELIEAASRLEWPPELRAEAVSAFGEAVMRRGLQLTRQQILRQYDRYNRSERLDRVTQKLLGLILDYIEMPSQGRPATTAERP